MDNTYPRWPTPNWRTHVDLATDGAITINPDDPGVTVVEEISPSQIQKVVVSASKVIYEPTSVRALFGFVGTENEQIPVEMQPSTGSTYGFGSPVYAECLDEKCQALGRCIYGGLHKTQDYYDPEPKKQKRAVSRGKRFEILARDKFRCAYCGLKAKETQLEVDHIDPISKGGSNADSNLITACKDCNRGKRDKPINKEDLQ